MEISQDRSIELTNTATDKIISVLKEGDCTKFRVYVTGGGCSGFQYKWELTDEQEDGVLIDDILVVDKIAEIFILGCTVDYVKEFGGSYLKVVNPNATAQCGCGESFAV